MALYRSEVTINDKVIPNLTIMEHLAKNGVKYVQIYGVDNAIVRVRIDSSCNVGS